MPIAELHKSKKQIFLFFFYLGIKCGMFSPKILVMSTKKRSSFSIQAVTDILSKRAYKIFNENRLFNHSICHSFVRNVYQ